MRFSLLVILVTAGEMLFPNMQCFAAEKYTFVLPDKNEPIYGIWTNKDYSGNVPDYAQKWVYYNWGYFETYNKATDANPSARSTFILVEKWNDTLGNALYKEYDQSPDGPSFTLVRISKDGTLLEAVMSGRAFPKESEFNPKNYDTYRVYHRQ
jgi:hypothetical protein